MIRIIYASSVSATITAIFTAAITILAELSEPLKNGLKSISGHHWTTKSILVVVIYLAVLALVYSANKNPSKNKVRGSLHTLTLVFIAGSLSILGFYLWHTFK